MSKHNYSQYSNKKNHNRTEDATAEEFTTTAITPENEPALEVKMEPVITETVVEPVAETVEPVAEPVETVTLPKKVKGTVANCTKLNIRTKASADAAVIRVLNAGTKVDINVNKSNAEWLSVRTPDGINGYCMRKFVDARL